MPRAVILLLPVIGAGLLAGCERDTPQGLAPPSPRSPRATVQQLLTLAEQQRFRELAAGVVPPQGGEVVDVLMAVNGFLTANRQLCNWLRDNAGVGLSQTIDQSYVLDDLAVYAGDGLGVFSRRVRLLDERIHVDSAFVSYAVQDRMPARQVQLRLLGNEWRLDPGRRVSPELAEAFVELRRGLEQVLSELESGHISAASLRDGPDVLIEKVKVRLRRGVALLSKSAAPASAPASALSAGA